MNRAHFLARRQVALAIAGLAAATAGCGTDSADPAPSSEPTPSPAPVPTPCPAYLAIPWLTVRVTDAMTVRVVDSATGTATFEDMTTRFDFRYSAEAQRLQLEQSPPKTGLYSITVRAPGYRNWTRERVEWPPPATPADPCPKVTELFAELIAL